MRKMACDEAMERRGKDLPKVRVKEEGKSEHGESGKGATWGNAIIKYKGWNTYCDDYGSFP